MNDLPSTMLLQQSHSKSFSGEELETMGKQAAAKYLSGSLNLSEAVVETVKKAGLSPEQVKRVAEFANTDAYLREFRKEGAANKVVEFVGGPADVSEILKDLNDGGGGTVFDPGNGDYNQPPSGDYSAVKTAAVNYDEELKALFTTGQEAVLPFADPLGEAIGAREKLAAAHELAAFELTQLELAYEEVGDRLFHNVKQASLSDEVSLGQVVQAWSEVTDNPELVKAAFSMLTPRLVENGVFADAAAVGDSLTKQASAGLVNMEHPLVADFGEFCEVLHKLAETRAVHEETAAGADSMNVFLRAAMAKQAGVAKSVMKGGKKAKELFGAAAKRTSKAGDLVESEVGGTAGKVLGKLTKYSPHLAVAAGASELNDQTKFSPLRQGTVNAVKSRIPHTRQWQIRQYNLQNRYS